jgi:predicted ATPase
MAAALAGEKGASFWKAFKTLNQGCLLVLSGQASEALEVLTPRARPYGATGATIWTPLHLSYLARAHAECGQTDHARQYVEESLAILEKTGERWCEAEVHRVAGEISLKSRERHSAKAQTHFARAIAVARGQRAKSWELRAAMSMARLRRDQGRRQQAHDLLAPLYGWFTEGFDTLDLKDAKALLSELAQ